MLLQLLSLCLISYTYLLHVDDCTCFAFLLIIIPQSVLRQVQSLFQSDLSTEYDRILHFLISSVPLFT